MLADGRAVRLVEPDIYSPSLPMSAPEPVECRVQGNMTYAVSRVPL